MATSKWASVAALAAACTLVLSACGNSDSSSPQSADDGGSKGKVGVILPDATTSPRWENNDRPSLTKAFDKLNITELNPLGEPFDPAKHEAMLAQPSTTAEPNSVLQVVQRGYELNGRLLRPARVIVAKAP